MDDAGGTQRYDVVVNGEQQYSIWSVELDVPHGWKRLNRTGTKSECLDFIEQVWTDMRPLSVQQEMVAPVDSGGAPLDVESTDLSSEPTETHHNPPDTAGSLVGDELRHASTSQQFMPDSLSRRPPSRRHYQYVNPVQSLATRPFSVARCVDDRTEPNSCPIDLREIESALMQHQLVHRSVVMRFGSSGRVRLVAYCIADAGDHTDKLKQFLSDRVPSYLIPSAFVTMDHFPLKPNGRIDRNALRKINISATSDKASIRNELELTLLEMWRDALKNNAVGVHDNFFEFGGHSLLAMRLLGTIEDRLGKSLPLSSLFSHSSVAEFADAIEHSTFQQFGAKCVKLNHGKNGPPVVMVAGLIGELGPLRTLTKHLPDDLPIYGLRLVGDRAYDQNCNSLEDLAQIFITALKAKLPRESYRLVGYSFGALTAFEMARQLADAGDPASPVVAIDSGPQGPTRGVTDFVLSDIPSMMWNLPRWLVSDQVRYAIYKLGLYVKTKFDPNSNHRQESALEMADGVLRKRELRKIPRSYRRLALQGLEFERAYDPPSHNGRIIVVRTKVRPLVHQAKPDLGWGRIATPVEVHTTTGVHGTVFHPRHIDRLADTVTSAILTET